MHAERKLYFNEFQLSNILKIPPVNYTNNMRVLTLLASKLVSAIKVYPRNRT